MQLRANLLDPEKNVCAQWNQEVRNRSDRRTNNSDLPKKTKKPKTKQNKKNTKKQTKKKPQQNGKNTVLNLFHQIFCSLDKL